MPDALAERLTAALDRRAELLGRLHGEGTDADRLFHGTVEGKAGLTVDRYGDLLLAQSFHCPLSSPELATLGRSV